MTPAAQAKELKKEKYEDIVNLNYPLPTPIT